MFNLLRKLFSPEKIQTLGLKYDPKPKMGQPTIMGVRSPKNPVRPMTTSPKPSHNPSPWHPLQKGIDPIFDYPLGAAYRSDSTSEPHKHGSPACAPDLSSDSGSYDSSSSSYDSGSCSID